MLDISPLEKEPPGHPALKRFKYAKEEICHTGRLVGTAIAFGVLLSSMLYLLYKDPSYFPLFKEMREAHDWRVSLADLSVDAAAFAFVVGGLLTGDHIARRIGNWKRLKQIAERRPLIAGKLIAGRMPSQKKKLAPALQPA